MTWVKLSDDIFRNRKVHPLSKDGKLLFVGSIAYSCDELSDGFLSGEDFELVAAMLKVKNVRPELERARLLDPVDGGWIIHDFLEYQEPAAKVIERRESDRKRKGIRKESNRNPDRPPPDSKDPVPGPVPNSPDSPSSEPVLSATEAEVEAAGAELANLRERVFLDNGGKIGNPSGFRRDAQERAVHDIVVWLKANPRGTVDQAVDAVGPVLGARREDPLENTARAQEARIARAKNPCPECINGQVETEAGCIPCPSCNTKAVG